MRSIRVQVVGAARIKNPSFQGGSPLSVVHAMGLSSTGGSATIASESGPAAALAVGWAVTLSAAHFALCASRNADDAVQFIRRCPMTPQA